MENTPPFCTVNQWKSFLNNWFSASVWRGTLKWQFITMLFILFVFVHFFFPSSWLCILIAWKHPSGHMHLSVPAEPTGGAAASIRDAWKQHGYRTHLWQGKPQMLNRAIETGKTAFPQSPCQVSSEPSTFKLYIKLKNCRKRRGGVAGTQLLRKQLLGLN